MSRWAGALALCAAAALPAQAGGPEFTFSGFGTLGLVHSTEDEADYVANGLRPSGAGYTHSLSAAIDSRFGGQLRADFTPSLAAVLQVIAEQRHDDSVTPTIEWANVRWQTTPGLAVRAGRVVLSALLASEHRKVGYAQPWVRPPVEVYRLVPVTNIDGAAAEYRYRAGRLTNTIGVHYGRGDPRTPGGTVHARDGWGVFDSFEFDDTTLRVAYNRADVTATQFNTVFDGFRQFAPQGAAIAARYDVDDLPIEIVTLGASHDPGRWFLSGEWG